MNEILCFLGQTRYDDPTLLNAGPYVAMVDESKCSNGESEGGSQSQASGGASASSSPRYTQCVVDSSRASDAAEQIVRAWVMEEASDQDPAMIIRVEIHIFEGASAARPHGDFVLNFEGEEELSHAIRMRGTLRTVDLDQGRVGFTFFEGGGTVQAPQGSYAQGERYERRAAVVSMVPSGTAGIARTSFYNGGNWGGGSEVDAGEYEVAYEGDQFLRRRIENGTPVEESCRDRASTTDAVRRYNLYHAATGDRVELESGFSFFYEPGGASSVRGYLGYWGLWTDGDALVPSGVTIRRQNWGAPGGSSETYTLVTAPGRLVRQTVETLALSAITGTALETWRNDQRCKVEFDGVDFRLTAVFSEQSQSWVSTPTATITPATGMYLSLWSSGLGGGVSYIGGASEITFYRQESVSASDALFVQSPTIDLHGFVQGLRANISQAEVDRSGGSSPFLPDRTSVSDPIVYRITATDMTLRLVTPAPPGTDVVTLASGVTPSDSSPFKHGLRSGPMLLAGSYQQGDLSSVYDAFRRPVAYYWETGNKPWNRAAFARDAFGKVVAFDKPLQFTYVHTTGNDRNQDATYAGQTFLLEYGGGGDLHGIPHDIDQATGRWEPRFGLRDGTPLGASAEYVVKAIDIEQRLDENTGGCSGLSTAAAAALTLPTAPEGSPQIGAAPTGAPTRVVGGEVQ